MPNSMVCMNIFSMILFLGKVIHPSHRTGLSAASGLQNHPAICKAGMRIYSGSRLDDLSSAIFAAINLIILKSPFE